jgi:hypothetical protein
MRHRLPSTQFRRIGALVALAALVAAASIGLAYADTPVPVQVQPAATAR